MVRGRDQRLWAGLWAQEPIQFIHLWGGWGRRSGQPLPHRGHQVGDTLAADALEVNMAALSLLLLPGELDERPLDVVVDHLRLPPRTPLHLLLTGGVP